MASRSNPASMQARRGATRWRGLFALLLWLTASGAAAQSSYFRLYDQDYGLNVGEIAALAQDDQGFLWLGAHRGLVRFDGRSFVAWAPEQLDEGIYQLLYGPDDQLLLRTSTGHGWRRTAQGLEPIAGPQGAAQLSALASFDFDAAGCLWAVLDGHVWQRDRALNWTRIERGLPADEIATRIFAVDDGVVVLTDRAAWQVTSNAAAHELLRAADLWFATAGNDGAIWLSTHFGSGLWRIDAAGVQAIPRPPARALDLRRRGRTIWLALDRALLSFEADGRRRQIGIADGLPSGGPLLVDREQSLWLGTFVGLLQFPQPDTWQWSEAEGLPSAHAYSVAEYDGVVFASTWGGLAHLDTRSGTRFVADFPSNGGIVCADPQHGVWSSDGSHLLAWRNGRFAPVAALPPGAELSACAFDAHGVPWFATRRGLLHLTGAPSQPQLLRDADAPIDQVWFDANAQIHVASEDRVCRLDPQAAALRDCTPLPTVARANDLAQVSPERTWLVANDGIFEFDGTQARRLRGNHLIEGGITSSLTPSRDGDWWAAGAGVLQRIHPCADCAGDWQVHEAPGRWQGIPGTSAIKAVETASGDLWIAGNRGLWQIPQSARAAPTQVPNIVPVRIAIDGVEQARGNVIELGPQAHRLELEFAALSFRDRNLLRFRSRLDGHGDWSAPTRSALLQFAALEPGAYRAEMSASLDGEHWSAAPATIDFRVLPPWYARWWARTLLLLALAALATWIYRQRVAALLRIERERTRIAMDLHDELGAGLGSIGMLAGVAAKDDLARAEQRRLLGEIATVSGLLGSGLRSLVWSLRSGRAGLAELAAQIADHARRLFPGDEPRLSVQLPVDPPATVLAPELRRNVLLLALEALHNISRHARATRVRLTLDTEPGGGFHLRIEDDGCGFDHAAEFAGLGLESMQRRARAIGADLQLESTPGNGTRLLLRYPPRARSG